MIHHGDGRRGDKMRSEKHYSKVCGSPRVTPCPCLIKFVSSMMTQSSQFYLTRSDNELISFQYLGLMYDMFETM